METLRPERPDDAAAVLRVHAEAFPTLEEARLVERLRAAGLARLALVAEIDGEIAGHILFSPVTIGEAARGADAERNDYLGLAPIAVRPQWQSRGIGSRLIRAGIEACRELGTALVVVLGEPEYYARFGFVTASRFGLANEYGVDEPFRVLELRPGTLDAVHGTVRYSAPFAVFG